MPRAIKAQLQREGGTQLTSGSKPDTPSPGDQGGCTSGPIGHLPHNTTLPTLRDVGALPNTWKQTQGGSQNEETKKISIPNEVTTKLQKKN